MKKNIIIALFGFGILIFGFAGQAVAVPQYINYQGILRDVDGNLQDGTFPMVFKIYDAETFGNEEFSSGATDVSVSNGLYNVRLGPVTSSIFDGDIRYLEIQVSSDILSPRLQINSVAYAIMAASAEVATTAQTADTAVYAANSGTATTAASADYATLSGTATNAGDADTVDGIDASSTAIAGQLLALSAGPQFKGMSVSAEASVSNYALYVNGGKIGVKTGTNMSAGTGTISAGSSDAVISNVPLTANSIIILTVGHAATPAQNNATDRAIKVGDVNVGGGTFTARTMDGSNPNPNDIPFSYLIIN